VIVNAANNDLVLGARARSHCGRRCGTCSSSLANTDVRFVLLDKAARLIFEPAFRAVFEGSGDAVG
jgi:hypothetical protein